MARSRSFYILIGILLVSLVGAALVVGLVASVARKGGVVAEKAVLDLRLGGTIVDGPAGDPLTNFVARFEGNRVLSLWDLKRGLEKAATDDRVKALRLIISTPGIGWGMADEVVELLDGFRASGKPIYAFLSEDFAGDGAYYLATAADEIWTSADAALMVNGLHIEVPFWRGTLDKLHVQPYFIMYKEYKSAGEPLSRYSMSEYMREQYTEVGEAIVERLVERIAERRGLAADAVRQLVDKGLLTADEAEGAGLIDAAGDERDVEESLEDAVGAGDLTAINFAKYTASRRPPLTKTPKVAVVFGEGPIVATAGRQPFGERLIVGPDLAEQLDKAADDDSVKAVVFRVNSPGGSPSGSEVVRQALLRLREKGKPVVVSMSSVAGSGGYWVAMSADKIVAQPLTITGSIGVVLGKLDLAGLYELIGAKVETIKVGENADLFSQVTPMSESHEARFRAWMDETYRRFKEGVSEGRKIALEDVEKIAKGRIYTGARAREIGLVDELGGLKAAVDLARSLAGLGDDVPAVAYPGPKSLSELLAELSGAAASTLASSSHLLAWLGLGRDVVYLPEVGPVDRRLLLDLATPRPMALMPMATFR